MYSKYELYEASVQDPQAEVDFWQQASQELIGKPARSMREDFCATFWNAATWVKQHKDNTAIAVDISKDVLDYGKKKHFDTLSSTEQSRLRIVQNDVMKVNDPKVDMVTVSNFSIFFFKERLKLLAYLKQALGVLNDKGFICVDVLGGTQSEDDDYEERTFKVPRSKEEITYIWEQEEYNPISRETRYSIHYKFKNKKKLKRAFTYDWRMWSIPELKDLMLEAGFKDVVVYWEEDDEDGEGSGVYSQHEDAENCASWIAYVIGIK
ncbi:class I SAM-dependent methyltransferase [bacterium]|nr:class I SAM-dependent methyltransferase [bacterium]